ncbi:porin family protein [Fibrobacter sp. UWB11]|uniref:porin family protein n=1 Tax=Fibrobacter sp. UWB11 TaxID=1896202 RepID=UPI00092B331D|nr:porin family protein [Fibrobacter sp. UWB11]SIO02483.1 Outer membrane protein beta-barrel domain-containing protein [Fibrobacter sp. UWB11]
MNLKYTGILTALAVSAVMAQNEAPAPVAEVAPVQAEQVVEQTAAQAPAPVEDKFTQAEKELAPENLFSEPTAVRGADAAKPVQKKPTKKFVYRPVYSPAEIEPNNNAVKTIYVSEVASPDTIDMDQLRGRIPLKFTFGIQGFVGSAFLSGDNGRYEYDRYSGLAWSVGAFALFPLDEYNMAFKTGVLFDHDKVSNSYNDTYNETFGEYRTSFNQYRISVPLLLSLKSANSNFFFDVGVQPSFAVSDNFKLKSSDQSSSKAVNIKEDMLDNDYRSVIDWSIVFGFGIRANRYIGFEARFIWGINNQYDDYNAWPINNLSSKAVSVGATFYAF